MDEEEDASRESGGEAESAEYLVAVLLTYLASRIQLAARGQRLEDLPQTTVSFSRLLPILGRSSRGYILVDGVWGVGLLGGHGYLAHGGRRIINMGPFQSIVLTIRGLRWLIQAY